LAFNTTDDPEQKVVEDAGVIVAFGREVTVTVVAAEVAEHPEALVTNTV
jgi:hypothetical protein